MRYRRCLPSSVFEHLGNVKRDIARSIRHRMALPTRCVAANVGTGDESDGDNVMREHLPVIATTCFDVKDEDLLNVEGARCEVVEFEEWV